MLQILNVVVSFFGAFEHFLKINQMSFALYMDFWLRFRLRFWFRLWFRFRFRFQFRFRFWQSYFIKLFDADLQCEFIRTFFKMVWSSPSHVGPNFDSPNSHLGSRNSDFEFEFSATGNALTQNSKRSSDVISHN